MVFEFFKSKHATPPQLLDKKYVTKILDDVLEKLKDSELVNIIRDYKSLIEGNTDKQMGITLEALAKEPNNADLLCHLATMYKMKGSAQLATACFDQALKNNPNHSDSHYNYANLLRETGHLDTAESHYRKCIEIDWNDYNAHNNLAEVLRCMKRFDESEDELMAVIEIYPLHFKAHSNLGILFAGRGEYGRAEECWKMALRIKPDYEIARNLLATLEKSKGW
jgi:tetratricopeptide (TPR) repeat protein